ncbi:MAG TPA: LacI family DNA-binding transcriptional regulator, partial [Anaerolineae bacterium]|nr:LacI family DNA-binding transcriptional regulator [Anaerolineae bacterium]
MGKILFNRSERSHERSTNNVSFVIGSFSITQSLSRKPTMAKYTTLKDVAKLAGVSYQTVS